MNRFLTLSSLAGVMSVASLPAATIIENYSSGTLNLAVPDGNPSGAANLINVPASEIRAIEEVSVTFSLMGTWNGDLYVTLQHSSGFAVLLNRVGRASDDAFGYEDSGFQVTLNDLAALNDIHSYQDNVGPQSPLTGTWNSDGRLVDPGIVVDTDPRTALLTSFVGDDADGDWTLFVADLSGGESQELVDWSIEVKGVPEPSASFCLLLGSALLLRRKRVAS